MYAIYKKLPGHSRGKMSACDAAVHPTEASAIAAATKYLNNTPNVEEVFLFKVSKVVRKQVVPIEILDYVEPAVPEAPPEKISPKSKPPFVPFVLSNAEKRAKEEEEDEDED